MHVLIDFYLRRGVISEQEVSLSSGLFNTDGFQHRYKCTVNSLSCTYRDGTLMQKVSTRGQPARTVHGDRADTFPYRSTFCFFVGWLVVLGFNATLTAKVISWRSVTHMCFQAMANVKVFADKQTDKRSGERTNKRAKKLYAPAPDLSMRGYKNLPI